MTAADRRLARVAVGALCSLAPAAAVLGAQASAAGAATISADKACYVNVDPAVGAPMTISGTGFIPGDTVELSGGTVFGTATADPTGAFTVPVSAPLLSTIGPGTLSTTVTATDNAANGTTVTASTLVQSANLAASTKPARVKNVHKDKATFTFSGFTPGKPIYGFYLRKKVVATVRYSKANGPCGTLTQRALLYPGGHPANDQYNVAFESTSHYSKSAFPRVTGVLNVGNL